MKLEAAVLERAGIEARVARNMMTLAEAGYIGETLHEAVGVNAALADLRRKSGREKSESDSDFSRMDAMLPELKAAAMEGNGIRLSAGQVSALVDAVAWTAPPYGDGNGSEGKFVGAEFAKATLLLRPLPERMVNVLMKLHGAHPGFVPAEELRDAAGCAPTWFAALMESFRWRLANTEGYDGNGHFFDWRYDDDRGVWECRLPDTVRRAMEEAFPDTYPAPDSGMDEPGATAGSDANP